MQKTDDEFDQRGAERTEIYFDYLRERYERVIDSLKFHGDPGGGA